MIIAQAMATVEPFGAHYEHCSRRYKVACLFPPGNSRTVLGGVSKPSPLCSSLQVLAESVGPSASTACDALGKAPQVVKLQW